MKSIKADEPRRPLCIVSACLCGVPCRYDGKPVDVESIVGPVDEASGASWPDLAALSAAGLVLPVCPELEGGLPAPRAPVELRDGRAYSRDGDEFTSEFREGAQKALAAARSTSLPDGTILAILKDKSPSCGSTCVYDGTFSSRLLPGQGMAAAWLEEHGVLVLNEAAGLRLLALHLPDDWKKRAEGK